MCRKAFIDMKKSIAFFLILSVILLSLASCTMQGSADPDATQGTQPESDSTSQSDVPDVPDITPLTPETVSVSPKADEDDKGSGMHYTEFVLRTPDRDITFSGRMFVYSENKIYVEDLTGDGYPEAVVIFERDRGTGVHVEEVHVFDGRTLAEYPVEDMIKTLNGYLELSSDDEDFIIRISESTYRISKSSLPGDHDKRFDKVSLGFIDRYSVSGGTLTYTTECMFDPWLYHGAIRATLEFNGDGFVFQSALYDEEGLFSE